MTLTKIQAAAVLTSASLLVAVPATLATWHYVAQLHRASFKRNDSGRRR